MAIWKRKEERFVNQRAECMGKPWELVVKVLTNCVVNWETNMSLLPVNEELVRDLSVRV
jgi:hypothetical protein